MKRTQKLFLATSDLAPMTSLRSLYQSLAFLTKTCDIVCKSGLMLETVRNTGYAAIRSLWLGVLVCFLVLPIGRMSAQVEQDKAPDSVLVGVYFTSLYDLDLAQKSFNVDFWLWFNYKNDSLKPLETVEVANAKDFAFSLPDTEDQDGMFWACHKCKALVKKEWDLRHFPFDRQFLDIRVEDAILDVSALRYIPDLRHSNYDRGIKLDEWLLQGFTMRQDDKSYATNFGNPTLDSTSTYPAVTATFEIRRDGLGLFFKLFVGIYVAYLISLMVFFMGPENPERFGLIVGALFAGFANKYIVDSIHNVTFAYIILHLVVTVIAYRFAANERIKIGWRIDRWAFVISLLSFVGINWYLVSLALAYL
jgi:hypothetical protein